LENGNADSLGCVDDNARGNCSASFLAADFFMFDGDLFPGMGFH